ncbi:hypothetical protein SNEBB_002807 [Seison nebaliae]|nr:hypothetical protein SNEBB_002807 [Seison nebaliae]
MRYSESEDDNVLWCYCRAPWERKFMITCDGCNEWYHGDCVGLTESEGHLLEKRAETWNCPICVETNRWSKMIKNEDYNNKDSLRMILTEKLREANVSNKKRLSYDAVVQQCNRLMQDYVNENNIRLIVRIDNGRTSAVEKPSNNITFKITELKSDEMDMSPKIKEDKKFSKNRTLKQTNDLKGFVVTDDEEQQLRHPVSNKRKSVEEKKTHQIKEIRLDNENKKGESKYKEQSYTCPTTRKKKIDFKNLNSYSYHFYDIQPEVPKKPKIIKTKCVLDSCSGVMETTINDPLTSRYCSRECLEKYVKRSLTEFVSFFKSTQFVLENMYVFNDEIPIKRCVREIIQQEIPISGNLSLTKIARIIVQFLYKNSLFVIYPLQKKTPRKIQEISHTNSPTIKHKKSTHIDEYRQTIRKQFFGKLSDRVNELEANDPFPLSFRTIAHIERVSEHIETALYETYDKAKASFHYRTLASNMKDRRNDTLFRNILQEKIPWNDLVQMTPQDLASKELKEWRKEETNKVIKGWEKASKENNATVVREVKGKLIEVNFGDVRPNIDESLDNLKVKILPKVVDLVSSSSSSSGSDGSSSSSSGSSSSSSSGSSSSSSSDDEENGSDVIPISNKKNELKIKRKKKRKHGKLPKDVDTDDEDRIGRRSREGEDALTIILSLNEKQKSHSNSSSPVFDENENNKSNRSNNKVTNMLLNKSGSDKDKSRKGINTDPDIIIENIIKNKKNHPIRSPFYENRPSKTDTTSEHDSHIYDERCRICNENSEETDPKNDSLIILSDDNDSLKKNSTATPGSIITNTIAMPETVNQSSDIVMIDSEEDRRMSNNKNYQQSNSDDQQINEDEEMKNDLSTEQKQTDDPMRKFFAQLIYTDRDKCFCRPHLISGSMDAGHSLLGCRPLDLKLIGRLPKKAALDYLEKINVSASREMLLMKLIVKESNKESYDTIFNDLHSHGNNGVISADVWNEHGVKDIYLIPLRGEETTPIAFLPYDGEGLPRRKMRDDLLIVAIVKYKSDYKRPKPLVQNTVMEKTEEKDEDPARIELDNYKEKIRKTKDKEEVTKLFNEAVARFESHHAFVAELFNFISELPWEQNAENKDEDTNKSNEGEVEEENCGSGDAVDDSKNKNDDNSLTTNDEDRNSRFSDQPTSSIRLAEFPPTFNNTSDNDIPMSNQNDVNLNNNFNHHDNNNQNWINSELDFSQDKDERIAPSSSVTGSSSFAKTPLLSLNEGKPNLNYHSPPNNTTFNRQPLLPTSTVSPRNSFPVDTATNKRSSYDYHNGYNATHEENINNKSFDRDFHPNDYQHRHENPQTNHHHQDHNDSSYHYSNERRTRDISNQINSNQQPNHHYSRHKNFNNHHSNNDHDYDHRSNRNHSYHHNSHEEQNRSYTNNRRSYYGRRKS